MKGVFLDRDGILCNLVYRDNKLTSVRSVEETYINQDVIDGCKKLKRNGFKLICVTNQPDISRGFTTMAEQIRICDKISWYCDLDAVEICPHDDKDGCDCRKPRAGMLKKHIHNYGLHGNAYMVGDTWRDHAAARSAGAYPLTIPNANTLTLKFGIGSKGAHFVGDFTHAVDTIINLDAKKPWRTK